MRYFDFREAVTEAQRGEEDDGRRIAIRNVTEKREFKRRISALGWKLIAPGDRIPAASKCHIVCCAATWSRPDMGVLSDLAETRTARECPTYIIDIDTVTTREELDNLITDVPTLIPLPLVAVFVEGTLSQWASGGKTVSLVASL